MRFEKMPVEVITDLLDEAGKNGHVTVGHCGFMGYEPVKFTSGYIVGGYSPVITISANDTNELCAALINNLIKVKNDETVTAVNEYLTVSVNEFGFTEIEFSRAYSHHWDAMNAAKKLEQRYIFDVETDRALKV